MARLDLTLSSLKNISRSRAKDLIDQGKVFFQKDEKKILLMKAAQEIREEDQQFLVVEENEEYVGRGLFKIKAAIEAFKIDVAEKIVADVGASTGGFTDFLLQNGALRSYAIDVGHNQLATKLQNDPRVINMEGQNIRELLSLPEFPSLLVVDLSFISLRKVISSLIRISCPDKADFLLLFKPQFEVGAKNLNKKGLVKNEELRQKALADFKQWLEQEYAELVWRGIIESPILGKEGNKEFLIHLRLEKFLERE